MTEKRKKSFINECAENETRFSKPIKKTKKSKFCQLQFSEEKETAKIRGTDIFGTLLYLAVPNGINLKIIFNYPILPKPSCFIHPDITVQSTNKAVIYLVKKRTFDIFYQHIPH